MIQTMERPSFDLAEREWRNSQVFHDESEEVVCVVIVEAHLLIREALQRVIGNFPQMCVSASLGKIEDVPMTLRRVKSHVLLLGSTITISDCLECVNTVQEDPTILAPGIVVIQQRLHPETAFSLIRGGVQGLLGEDASEKDLARAIDAAANGNTFLGQRAREILAGSASRIAFHFTEREVQILSLLRSGISNFHIAQQLGLKEKTVEKHLTHIYEKLHIRSRTEAILRIQTLSI